MCYNSGRKPGEIPPRNRENMCPYSKLSSGSIQGPYEVSSHDIKCSCSVRNLKHTITQCVSTDPMCLSLETAAGGKAITNAESELMLYLYLSCIISEFKTEAILRHLYLCLLRTAFTCIEYSPVGEKKVCILWNKDLYY